MVKKRKKKRKCLHCDKMYLPDARTRDRQKHCSAPDCKRASKKDSQRRWLSKPENKDYFRGPENTARVTEWRGNHPRYWKRCPKRENALQDDCSSEPVDSQEDRTTLNEIALQDDWRLEPAVIVGLIAHLTEMALQDDIAIFMRKLHANGQSILEIGSGIKKGEKGYDRKTSVVSGAGTSYSVPIQLG